MVRDLEEALRSAGLSVQPTKCSVLANAWRGRYESTRIFLQGVEVPYALRGAITVLGCAISADGSDEADHALRSSKAWSAFWRLRRFLLRRDLA
eukprot:9038854-Alexandrium_andersonii.AAC.1